MTDAPSSRAHLSGSLRHSTRVTPAHDVDVLVVASPARRCGYSQCGNELAYDGKGRPPEYCPDRRWPGSKSCKQMAAAERDGIRAAGLDAPLDEYAAVTERLLAAAGPFAQQLTAVMAAVADVRDGALARVGDAERRMAEARERAEQAERAAERARTDAARATTVADHARMEAEEARVRMVEARQEAEARVAAATDRLAAVEREHGQAVARHEAAENEQRSAEHRTLKALAEATLYREQAETAQAEIAELHRQAQVADTDRQMMTQRIKDLTQRITDLTEQRHAAAAREQGLETVVAALREENSALNLRVNEARVAAAAAEARADSAEARYTQLLTVLSDPAQRGAAAKGPDA